MTARQALAFVETHGVVLQAARGPVPSLAEFIAGERIRGSWWAHPKGHEIFRLAEAVVATGDVLVCKLIDRRVTYVHKRLWPALVRLSHRFERAQLAKVWSEHTASGAHVLRRIPYPRWLPAALARQAKRLTEREAEQQLGADRWLEKSRMKRKGRSMRSTGGPDRSA